MVRFQLRREYTPSSMVSLRDPKRLLKKNLAQSYSNELGRLRIIVRGMEVRSVPHERITQEYLRAERLALAHSVGERLIVLNRAAADAFDELSELLVKRSSDIERGVAFESVRSELLGILAKLDMCLTQVAAIGCGLAGCSLRGPSRRFRHTVEGSTATACWTRR
jgi:hypothetical protein